MKVAFVCGGFPSFSNPVHGIFNYRAVKGIKTFSEIEVFRIRLWRPPKGFLNTYRFDDIIVNEIFIPMFPYYKHSLPKNLLIAKYFSWIVVGYKLKKFDLLHSVGISFSGIISSFWAKRSGIKHVTQVTGSDLIFQIPYLKRRIHVIGWEQWVNGVSCNSVYLEKLFKKYYPNVPNVKTIYRGVDLTLFSPYGQMIHTIKKLKGTKFLFVGGFPHYPDIPYGENLKGGKTLQRAWEIIDERIATLRTPPRLIIAGPNSKRRDIEKWRYYLRHPEYVTLLGNINPMDIPKVYRSVDVLLLPSMSEGMPNSAVEASACGIPVFGSRVAGIPELISNNINGLLLRPDDEKEWARTIIKYSTKKEELKVMGNNARKIVEEKFDQIKFIQNIKKLYEKVLNGDHDC